MCYTPGDPISSTSAPRAMLPILYGRGIYTVGALMNTDAYKAVSSGRYDLDIIREVNGLPIDALRWLVEDASVSGALEAVH